MSTKKHTLYSRCCQAELEEETGRCSSCREWEPDPIEEPDLLQEEETYYLD